MRRSNKKQSGSEELILRSASFLARLCFGIVFFAVFGLPGAIPPLGYPQVASAQIELPENPVPNNSSPGLVAAVGRVAANVFDALQNFLDRFGEEEEESVQVVSPSPLDSSRLESLEKELARFKRELANLSARGLSVIPASPEQIVERVVSISGVSAMDLRALENSLKSEIYRIASSASSQNSATYAAVAATNNIDALFNVTVSGATITNSSFSGPSVTATSLTSSGTLSVSDTATFSGNVGIGTTTPGSKLTIMGGDLGKDFEISGSIQPRISLYTTTPGSKQWSITNEGNANRLRFLYADDAAGTNAVYAMVIDGAGKVGIGTTSPYAKLSVAGPIVAEYFNATSTTGTSTFAGLTLIGSNPPSNADNQYALFVKGDTANGRSAVNFLVDRGATPTTFSRVLQFTNEANTISYGAVGASSDTLEVGAGNGMNLRLTANRDIIFWSNGVASELGRFKGLGTGLGNFGLGTTSPWAKLSVAGSPSDSATPLFSVSSSTPTATTTVFHITSQGSVGIGTTSPGRLLHISGAGNANINIDETSTNNAVVNFLLSGSIKSVVGIVGAANGGITGSAAGDLILRGNNQKILFSGDGGTPHAVITAAGNVGIGTTGPAAKLDVRGTFQVDSTQSADWTSQTIERDNAFAFAVVRSEYLGSNSTANVKLFSGAVTGAENFYVKGSGESYFAGNVGIGTTSPWRTLSVTGTAGFDGLTASTGSGSLCLSASKEVVFNSGSDACLSSLAATKHDIASLGFDGLSLVRSLRPVSFIYNEGDGRIRYGFVAEEASGVDPQLGTYDATGRLSGIDDRALIAALVKAVQKLDEDIHAAATASSTASTNAWAVDMNGGLTNVNFFGDVNLQGHALLDVSRISGYQGKWSIDEEGRLTAKEVHADLVDTKRLRAETGITTRDAATGLDYCISVTAGVVTSTAGECGTQVEIVSPVDALPPEAAVATTSEATVPDETDELISPSEATTTDAVPTTTAESL